MPYFRVTATALQLNASSYAYDSFLGSCPRTNITTKSDVGAYTYGAARVPIGRGCTREPAGRIIRT